MSLMVPHRSGFAGSGFNPSSHTGRSNLLYSTHVVTTGEIAEQKRLAVRLATSDAERNLARELINKMYDWRGYGNCHSIPATKTHSTFLAALDDAVVGTITLAVDTPEGLAVDGLFRDEINSYRRVPGASVCELTKLAFDSDMPSRKLLASLFHIVFIYGKRRHRCTDLFIEVNPRHRRFYEAMLGFKPIGSVKINSSVDAPSQLMWLKVADIAVHIRKQAGRNDATSCRSLYPLFLSRRDQRTVGVQLSRSLTRRWFEDSRADMQDGRVQAPYHPRRSAVLGNSPVFRADVQGQSPLPEMPSPVGSPFPPNVNPACRPRRSADSPPRS